jgi:regulator of replication initiation timing
MNPDLYAKQRTDSFLKSGNVAMDVKWSNYAFELQTELAAAKAECERLAKPCGWPHCEPAKADATELARLRAELAIAENWVDHHSQHADDLIGENVRLRAEVERWKTVAATMSAEREHNANEASRLRAEVDRLNDIINRASVQFFDDGTDGETAAKMLRILNETKLLKNETTTS